jgi:hypothetical protein
VGGRIFLDLTSSSPAKQVVLSGASGCAFTSQTLALLRGFSMRLARAVQKQEAHFLALRVSIYGSVEVAGQDFVSKCVQPINT